MSHLKERSEKNCLNCNAQVYGKYCHICGQENIEPKESAWHLVNHFFQDITHFDGKFFNTVKLLVTRPGFLSYEYMAGRRASYLNPIRMYIFTSAFFFLIFFTVNHFDTTSIQQPKSAQRIMSDLKEREASLEESLKENDDSISTRRIRNYLAAVRSDIDTLRKDSTKKEYLKTMDESAGFSMSNKNYRTVKEYDSVQQSLPGRQKDSWLERTFTRKTLAIKEKYKGLSVKNVLLAKFFHTFPQLLFLSLPLFALLLKMLYARRKRFYYADHGIFSIHLYIFCFIALLVMMGVTRLGELVHWQWLSTLNVAIIIGMFFYLYKAMRNFYEQRRGKTILKFILLDIMALFVFILLFAVFFIFSFYQL